MNYRSEYVVNRARTRDGRKKNKVFVDSMGNEITLVGLSNGVHSGLIREYLGLDNDYATSYVSILSFLLPCLAVIDHLFSAYAYSRNYLTYERSFEVISEEKDAIRN